MPSSFDAYSGSEPESVEVANRSKGYMRDQFEMVSNRTDAAMARNLGGRRCLSPPFLQGRLDLTLMIRHWICDRDH